MYSFIKNIKKVDLDTIGNDSCLISLKNAYDPDDDDDLDGDDDDFGDDEQESEDDDFDPYDIEG